LFAFIGINGLLALSVYCTLCCGQLSLANAGFMAIGAYAGAILTQNFHAPFGLAILAGTILPAVFAVPLGLPVLRLRGVFLGIATTRYKVSMFALGAALAGLAGVLEAHLTFMVAPNGYGFSRAVDMLVYAVVGGTTAFYGPVIGAAVLTLLPELLRGGGQALGLAPGPLRLFLNGAILLAVILFVPNGLASLPAAMQIFRPRRPPRSAALR